MSENLEDLENSIENLNATATTTNSDATASFTTVINATASSINSINATASSTETEVAKAQTESSAKAASNDTRVHPLDRHDDRGNELDLLRECTVGMFNSAPRMVLGDFDTPLPNREMSAESIRMANAETSSGDTDKRRQALKETRDRMMEQLRLQEEQELEIQILALRQKIAANNANPIIDLVDPPAPSLQQISIPHPSLQTILPPLPPITTETPVLPQQMGLLDFRKIVTLTGKISPDQADRFYRQSRQADFTLQWQQCIMDDALQYIRLRVKTSYRELKITEEEAARWNPKDLNTRDMADMVYKLFNNTPRTETTVQIFRAINEFNFGFDIKNKYVEEESHQNFRKMITDHYGPIENLDPDLSETIAKLLYKKLPAHSEMNKLYTDKVKLLTQAGHKDTIDGALDRYISVIQMVRQLISDAAAHAVLGDRFYSGSTMERQNQTTSSNHVISYGANTQRAAIIPRIPQVRDTDLRKIGKLITDAKRVAAQIIYEPHASYSVIEWQTIQVHYGISQTLVQRGENRDTTISQLAHLLKDGA